MKKYNIAITILIIICVLSLCIMFLPQYLQDRELTKNDNEANEYYESFKITGDKIDNKQNDTVTVSPEYSNMPDNVTPPPEEYDTTTGEWNPFGNKDKNSTYGFLSGLLGSKEQDNDENYNSGPRFGKYKYSLTDIDPVANPDAYNKWLIEKLKTPTPPTPTPVPTPEPSPTPKPGLTGVDLGKCYSENNDFIAWIKIPDTNVDYPIVQSDNIDYYMDHTFNGTKSDLGTLISLGKCNWKKPGKNIVIYGHDVEGTGKKMFKKLLDYKEESFYKSHKTIYLDSIYHTGVYKIFAAFDITLGDIDPSVTSFASNEEFIDFVYAAKDLSIYHTDVVINEDDTIITLVTCDRYFKKKIGRFVVMAVKVSD